ncbi:TIGR02679 domain-containing protein [Paenibacillus oceani]|uniref:DUF2399 domain-containing protein n=1 Tax=Paenibacillus oceani TaxID=2772510 RepID=A0A927CA38_9BACL|nr:TIGR02679 domain-containing protein [Paenibacillus oceani]MBD2862506.1 DUF2399 domain-containing protein [Paenibacillus oceani]
MTITTDAGIARKTMAFFNRRAYRRMLEAVWRKYESLGRIGGKAMVPEVSDEECEALNAFFGWDLRLGDRAEIPLSLFERELRESAFATGIVELHTLLEGKPLLSKQEKRHIHDTEWTRFVRGVRDLTGDTKSSVGCEWLSQLEEGFGAGVRMVRDLYKTDADLASASLHIVVRALNLLFAGDRAHKVEKAAVRLPVLAARCSGDAHALDANRPAGRLLISVLRAQQSGAEETEETAEERMEEEDGSDTLRLRELYRSFGILDDDISSIVHWYVPKPGLPASPAVWTLRQVEAAGHLSRCSHIYVVENPAVFSTILDSIREPVPAAGDPPALICTSGPASAAAIRWIQLILQASGEECKIVYSGDFDLKGLAMGETMARLFPGRFVPWRFDSATYQAAANAIPGPRFDDSELMKLESTEIGWDSQLCGHMRRMGSKVHQEAFVDELVRDCMAGGFDDLRG